MRDTLAPRQGMRVTWAKPKSPIARTAVSQLADKYGKYGLAVDSARKGFGRNWRVTLSKYGDVLRDGESPVEVDWSHLRELSK